MGIIKRTVKGTPLTHAELDGNFEHLVFTKVEKVTGKQLSTEDYTSAEKTKLSGIEANATADQTGVEIKSAYEAQADTNAYTDSEKSKLSGIESGATMDQTGAEIKLAYEAELNTNAYTDTEKTKLSNIEANATADQTGAEIKLAYEAELDTNGYTDAEKAKVLNVPADTNTALSGKVNTTGNETVAGIKTFSSSPVIPDATTNTQSANLGQLTLNGTSSARPTTNLRVGLPYFDTTLGKPVWYNGTGWVDATGTAV